MHFETTVLSVLAFCQIPALGQPFQTLTMTPPNPLEAPPLALSDSKHDRSTFITKANGSIVTRKLFTTGQIKRKKKYFQF